MRAVLSTAVLVEPARRLPEISNKRSGWFIGASVGEQGVATSNHSGVTRGAPVTPVRMRGTRPPDPQVRPRDAQPQERAALEALQWRASLHNEGDRAALLAHPDAIELPRWQIDDGLVRVVERAGTVAGFSVLLAPVHAACVLDGLFVEPDVMGMGLGRILVQDAARIARERGAAIIEVIANPHADGFYERLGFRSVGSVETRFGPGERRRLDLAR